MTFEYVMTCYAMENIYPIPYAWYYHIKFCQNTELRGKDYAYEYCPKYTAGMVSF